MSVRGDCSVHLNGTKEASLSYIDEENTTEWTPEIPFENVSAGSTGGEVTSPETAPFFS